LLEISPLTLKDFLTYIRDDKRYALSKVENFFASLSSFFDYSEWEGVQKYIPNIKKNIFDTTKNKVMKKDSLSAWSKCRSNRFCLMDQV
jgi:integrase/recombinase XerD